MDTIWSNHANKDKNQGFSNVDTELLSTSSDCKSWLCSLLLPQILVKARFIEFLHSQYLLKTSSQACCTCQTQGCTIWHRCLRSGKTLTSFTHLVMPYLMVILCNTAVGVDSSKQGFSPVVELLQSASKCSPSATYTTKGRADKLVY